MGAKNKLVALDVPSIQRQRLQLFVPQLGLETSEQVDVDEVGFTTHEGKLLHVSGSIDMVNPITLGSAGAVLTYLQRRRATEISTGDRAGGSFRINSIEMACLDETM